jgi:hypothetical protein
MKKTVSIISAIILLMSAAINASAVENGQIEDALRSTAAYIVNTIPNPQVSSIGGEWAVIGLARSGCSVPDEYYDNYYKTAAEYIKSRGGVLHEKKYTEYSRVILALTAIGANPENAGGYNLLLPLSDYENTIRQGLNGSVWALIALDSGNYSIPQNNNAKTQATREMYINNILECRLSDGGWSLSDGGASDPDMTAMALTALSGYTENENVSDAVEKALSYLSQVQNDDGGFSSWGTENSKSTAQVIVAMCSLGISPNDKRFVKNGKTAADSLLSYYQKDCGFKHTHNDSETNQMAAEQGLYALAALQRLASGKSALFDMSDVSKNSLPNNNAPANEYVNKMPVINPGRTFSDIAHHSSRKQIESLAQRNIISGQSEDIFAPDSTMTRAEFAAIAVKSLGLETVSETIFGDVSESDWFYPFVAAAYKRGIVSGVSEKEFNPNGIITKEEASVMVAKAAALCGINTDYEDFAARNILAGFTDYIKASGWARSSLAFCYDKNILDSSGIEIQPKKSVTRAEVAVMLYNLLNIADLL